MFLANVGDRIDGIEGSEYGGAGSSRDKERDFTVGDTLENEPFQFFRNHLTPLAFWDIILAYRCPRTLQGK